MAARSNPDPQQIDITFHYPPELFNLLVGTIPRLNHGKKDLFLFFQRAGVDRRYSGEAHDRWQSEASSINKFDIVRSVLEKLNAASEPALRERREVLKYGYCDDGVKLRIVRRTIVVETGVMK